VGYLIWRTSMGGSDAIGHQLRSAAGIMHRVNGSVCLVPLPRFTKNRNPEAQRRVVTIFNETLGWNEREAGNYVERFVKTLGLPTRLNEVGVISSEMIEQVADKTMSNIWQGGKSKLEYEGSADTEYGVVRFSPGHNAAHIVPLCNIRIMSIASASRLDVVQVSCILKIPCSRLR